MKSFSINRSILSGALVLAMAGGSLLAQKPKSPKEVEALQAMQNAQSPDDRIAAAQNVLQKFADTEFKAICLYYIAASYEQKGDAVKTEVFAERTLEADPQNYNAMLMLSRGIAAHTRENDLDKNEKLARAEKYAQDALSAIDKASKPNPQIPDDQWAGMKKDLVAQAHEGLGLVATDRKKYDVAINEYKTALDGESQPDPATMVRLAAAYNAAKQYDDALAILTKLNALPNLNPTIKQFAQAERVRAMQGKATIGGAGTPAAGTGAGHATAPATPPTTPSATGTAAPAPASNSTSPQVEVKKP